MEKIVLFEAKSADIKVSMTMYFENDKLIFDGYDIGKSVKDYFGDSDYEYTYTIEPIEVEKFYTLFGIENGNRNALLLEIKKRFEGNEAYSKFGDFMRENNIEFAAFTWR